MLTVSIEAGTASTVKGMYAIDLKQYIPSRVRESESDNTDII